VIEPDLWPTTNGRGHDHRVDRARVRVSARGITIGNEAFGSCYCSADGDCGTFGPWSEIRAEIAIQEYFKLYGCDAWQEE
jgi:hypothetical protein